MAKLGVTRSEFAALLTRNPMKLYDSLQRGIEQWDYDSNKGKKEWTPKPADAKFAHGLGVTPREVRVLGSDTADGASYVQENAAAVDGVYVTVAGAKAYYRVLAER